MRCVRADHMARWCWRHSRVDSEKIRAWEWSLPHLRMRACLRVSLSFQMIETVNESAQERQRSCSRRFPMRTSETV